MTRREKLLAAVIPAAVAVMVALLWRYPTFRLFFAWPSGGTWSNMIASLEWVGIGAFAVWLFRDKIGPRLAGWWHEHHGEHVRAELAAMEQRLTDRADRRHEDLKAHVTKETQ